MSTDNSSQVPGGADHAWDSGRSFRIGDAGTPGGATPESDAWRRAQEGPFQLRVGSGPHAKDAGVGGASAPAKAGPGDGSYAGRQPPLSPQASGRVLSSEDLESLRARSRRRGLPSGLVVAAVVMGASLLLAIGIVAASRSYLQGSKQVVSAAIDSAERADAEIALQNALYNEQLFYTERGRYSDDPAELEARQSGVAWVRGDSPEEARKVYVLLCDDAGKSVLLQYLSERGHIFAVYRSATGGQTLYARGPARCPAVSAAGGLTSGWSEDPNKAWAGSAPSTGSEAPEDILPPQGGPRPPAIPSPYSGGSGGEPYGGSDTGGQSGSSPGGYYPNY